MKFLKSIFLSFLITIFFSSEIYYKKNVSKIDNVRLSSKIEVIINAEKILYLQTYKIKNKTDDYILLKDLAKIFNATLTFYSKSGYVSFNYRGEKLYFHLNQKFFVTKKKRVFLSSENVIIKDKVYVPLTIFRVEEFPSLLDADVKFQKNVLAVNFIDNIFLDYYVSSEYAKINIHFKQELPYEQVFKEKDFIITIFGAKITPREYNIGGIVRKIILKKENGVGIINFLFRESNINIKREVYKNYITYEIAKTDSLSSLDTTKISTETYSLQNLKLKEEIFNTKRLTIVLDPGHGGEDPGAIGPNGTLEKNVNLSIAKYLKEMLIKEGYVVFLTREEDKFVPLAERTKFANDKNADIFVSIHCNASMKRTGTDKGFEIYFLSENATDPDAVATEKLENEVIKFEKQTPELTKLQKILWSMIVNEFMNESSKLCSLILEEVIQRTGLTNRGVKQAGFYVLRGTQMPSVLIECGFISNPYEEMKLVREDFQKMIANGIFAGIKNYEKEKSNKQ